MTNENSKTLTPKNIPIENIQDLPGTAEEKQPDKSYGTLVSSILINGLKEPVILRQTETGEYQLVDGYKRRRAAELAKLKELPALVYDMTEKEALEYRAKASKDPSQLWRPMERKQRPQQEKKQSPKPPPQRRKNLRKKS